MHRRQFVKASLASIVALSGTLVFGCAPGQSADSSTSSASPAPGTSSGTGAARTSDASSSSPDAQAGEAEARSRHAGTDAVAASAINMQVNGTTLHMALANTEAASALVELLQDGPITVPLHAYGGFEKVGPLPQALPASDEQITTVPGDVMLYQGSQITIFHGSNTWAYTPLGHIEDATSESLLAAFGEGDAAVKLSL